MTRQKFDPWYALDIWNRAEQMWDEERFDPPVPLYMASETDQKLYLEHAQSVMMWEETR